MKKDQINRVIVGGGVSVNKLLRKKIRTLVAEEKGEVYFPPYTYLNGDNAAMIGVAAYFKAEKGLIVKDIHMMERSARARIDE